MGIHIDDTAALGRGFARRLSEVRMPVVDSLLDVAHLLQVDVGDLPESDLYDYLRQRIYDELQGVGAK